MKVEQRTLFANSGDTLGIMAQSPKVSMLIFERFFGLDWCTISRMTELDIVGILEEVLAVSK